MPTEAWSDTIWINHLPDGEPLGDDLDTLDARLRKTHPMPDVVLDLAGLSSINSSHLGQLIRTHELLTRAGARLRLAAPPDNLWSIFLTTGLDRVMQFTPDTATALAELQLPDEQH